MKKILYALFPLFSSQTMAMDWPYNRIDLLMEAAQEGDVSRIAQLIADGVDVNAKNSYGETPLKVAVEKGHLNVTELLINKGAQVNISDYCGWTPLIKAAFDGHLEMVRLLIKAGADLDAKNDFGKTALDKAYEREHGVIVVLLEMAKKRAEQQKGIYKRG